MTVLRHVTLWWLTALCMVSSTVCAEAQDAGWYIRQQQREECERQGGRYDYPKCYLPAPDRRDSRDDKPFGRLHHKHVGSCSYDVLIAYVPRGKSDYTVEGWWEQKPELLEFWDYMNGPEYVVPNAGFPIYYFIKWTDKQRRDNLTKDRTFTYEGRDYQMTKIKTDMYEGKRWIEIVCY